MILRNKKTGKIQEIVVMPVVDGYPNESILVNGEASLKDFNELWEDYVPKESLIKDEKIRGIIRSWAKINGATELKYFEGENCLEDIFRNEIHFNQPLCLEDGKTYTIDELCGEEEESRPVIVNGVEYDSYADYLKSREEEE